MSSLLHTGGTSGRELDRVSGAAGKCGCMSTGLLNLKKKKVVPQASICVLFECFNVYRLKPHCVIDIIMENWEEGSSNSKNEIQYLLDLRTKLNPLIHVTLI